MSQSRELLSRNDKATVRINTAHPETPLTMPPPVAVPAGSALSFVGAWTSLSQRGALPSDLHIQTLPEQYLAVLIGDRAVGLCPYGDAASHDVAATLSNRAHLVNAMLSRVVMVYPCVSGLLVIDMDRITRDPAIRSLIRPEWETSNELVSIALVDAAARDNLPSSTTHPLSDELRTMWNATVASINAGMDLSREVPLKIKTIAIPSARSPEMLERCLRSHLDSMRTFCHTPPKIVVYDDASPEHQAQKKELCEKLSLEYVTTIEHRGDTEREHFLKSIVSCSGLQARESELREICFKRNSFGTMRNWIHLSNSGTTYATVDDDSLSEITVPKTLPLSHTLQFHHIIEKVLRLVIQDRTITVPEHVHAALERAKNIKVDNLSYNSSLCNLSIALTILYGSRRQPSSEPLTSIVEPLLTTAGKDLFTENRRIEGTSWVTELRHSVEHSTSCETLLLSVDLLSAHERSLRKTPDEFEGLAWGEGQASTLYRDATRPASGSVRAVFTSSSWTGAGSFSNRISGFLDRRDASELSDSGHLRFMSIPARTLALRKGVLSTTTMTSIAGEGLSRGLLVSGPIDSHPLWRVVQRGDPELLLGQTAASVDHHAQPKPPASPDDAKAIGEACVEQIALSLAYKVVFSGLPQDDAISELLADVFGFVLELRAYFPVAATTDPTAFEHARLATAIIEGLGAGLGFREGMPGKQDMEKCFLRSVKTSPVVRRAAHSDQPNAISMSGISLAQAYLLIPKWRQRVTSRIEENIRKVRLAEEFGELLHGAVSSASGLE